MGTQIKTGAIGIGVLILASGLCASHAEARRVSIDDTLIPSFLLPFSASTTCSDASLCLAEQLPYRLDLGGGQLSSQAFINNDGVITFGTERHGSPDDLRLAGANFAAPVIAFNDDYVPGLARFHVTTADDVRNSAAGKLFACENFGAENVEFICTDTVDEFIAANNWNKYLGEVVIQSGAGFVVLHRNGGSDTGVGTLYTDEQALEFNYNVDPHTYYSDFSFVGQDNGGSDSFDFAISAGVPEPASWLMLVMGFGALGAALRTSRRKVVISYNPV
jgi:hypothetical protein